MARGYKQSSGFQVSSDRADLIITDRSDNVDNKKIIATTKSKIKSGECFPSPYNLVINFLLL